MEKIIRLTESDLTRLVKRVIEEQNSSNDIVLVRTNFIMKLLNKGFKFTPNAVGSASAFRPKNNDLMIDGYDGKPLIFTYGLGTNGETIVSLERDGVTIRKFQGGAATRYTLPKDLDKFFSQLYY